LGGLSNRVFASKYKLALPSERELKLKLKSIPKMLEEKMMRTNMIGEMRSRTVID